MGCAYQQKSGHPFTEFCVFLGLFLTTETRQFSNSTHTCNMVKSAGMYMGSRNVTQSGKACQSWSENYAPHAISDDITDAMFPDGSKEAAKNFCRNPDIESRDGVWCYTMDPKVEWEFCDPCPGKYEGYNACVLPDKGAGYMGVLAHSKSFQECLPWSNQSESSFVFPDGSAHDAENYCRNPNPSVRDGPWCYVNARGATWDYCDVCKPFEGQVTIQPGSNNWANHNGETMSRLACLHWCITVTYCLAVVVKKVDRGSCTYMTKYGEESKSDDSVEIYNVYRSCQGDTEGRKAYYVEFVGVTTKDSDFMSKDQTIDECFDACIVNARCLYLQKNVENDECTSQCNVCCPQQEHAEGVVTRFPVYCDPALQPTNDVTAAINEELPTGARWKVVFRKYRTYLIAGSLVIVLIIVLCCCSKYLCPGKKKNAAKNSKSKHKHKESEKVKLKGKGAPAGKLSKKKRFGNWMKGKTNNLMSLMRRKKPGGKKKGKR